MEFIQESITFDSTLKQTEIMETLTKKIQNLAVLFTKEDEPAYSLSNEVANRLFDLKVSLEFDQKALAFRNWNYIYSFLDRKSNVFKDNQSVTAKIESIKAILSAYDKYFTIDAINN